LIKDKLIEGIIKFNLIEEEVLEKSDEIYNLDRNSEEIADQLKKMGLIWDAIQEEFEMMIQK